MKMNIKSVILNKFKTMNLKSNLQNSVIKNRDNSPNKIGKYFYGYNILCQSFDKVIQSSNEDTYILLGGAENYRKELNLTNFKGKLYTI